MAAFLNAQLDFIFFFYGLAFVLLGGVCFAIRRHSLHRELWALLGAFGLVHGASEWLDLSALILGNTPAFAVFRTGVMTVSFMLLFEFARLGAKTFGWWMPGRWIHVPLLLGVIAGGLVDGTAEANALARYSFGLIGALGGGFVLAAQSHRLEGVHRRLAISASLAFFFYGVAAGLIVPSAPIWPANSLNYEWFTAHTGMPIQLIRALLACWIAFAVWGIWGQKVIQTISAPHYSQNLRQLFATTLSAIALILILGWVLTQYLGGIYKHNVEAEANSDIDLVVGYLSGTTAATAGITEALAGAPSVQAYLSGQSDVKSDWAAKLLDLDIAAARASGGVILDRGGAVVTESGRHHAIDLGGTNLLQEALDGRSTQAFGFVPSDGRTVFYASAPILNPADGTVQGVAVLERHLEDFARDLKKFDKPLALVDPSGVVVMSNKPEWQHARLWPAADGAGNKRAGKAAPPLSKALTDPTWTITDGSRAFAQRRFVGSSAWSIVMITTAPGIFASRVLGIAMTLMATGIVLVYLAGRERHIFESFQKDQRLELEELARDLRYKASTDPLTGLSNRLKLNHQLDQEVARAARYGSPVSFILYDIDRFKDVNDNYGHPAGDRILVELSGLVNSAIRKTDLLARWGGEEFAIVVPHAGIQEAAELAYALRDAIEAHSFSKVGKITCSFGVAEYRPGDTPEALVARADGLLYLAKMGGRNRVEVASQAHAAVERVA